MKPKRCQNCIYAVEAAGKVRSVLVCTNKQDSNGRLFLLEMQGTCRNFQGPKKIIRPKIKQPENDEIRFIIGHFADEILAAKAYDKKAKDLFGEFAYLSFPKQIERR